MGSDHLNTCMGKKVDLNPKHIHDRLVAMLNDPHFNDEDPEVKAPKKKPKQKQQGS